MEEEQPHKLAREAIACTKC